MRLIAFDNEGTQLRKILDHIGVDTGLPQISPARAPPLCKECGDAQMDDGAQIEPADWHLAAQTAPDCEVDRRINWGPEKTVTQTRWRVAVRPPAPAHRPCLL